MRLLLDAHVLLWAVLKGPRLSAAEALAISDGDLYVSTASVWEIGIKRVLGELDVPKSLFDVITDAGCRPLPMSWTHAQAAADLPMHYTDPVNRMLIARSRCKNLGLASSDRKPMAYDVTFVV